MAFHLAVAEAAHNEVLRNAVQLLRNLMRQWLVLKLMIPQVPSNVLKQHEAIFRAIEEHDAEAARNAMDTHLKTTAHLLEQVVQRSGKSSQNGRGRRGPSK
jgi:GntR family transcriptional repressor for pyruvate dehydrogenase complex